MNTPKLPIFDKFLNLATQLLYTILGKKNSFSDQDFPHDVINSPDSQEVLPLPFDDDEWDKIFNTPLARTQEENKEPLVLENPIAPYKREFNDYMARQFEKEGRPFTEKDYDKIFAQYVSVKGFLHEDKAPILEKMWEDSKVVYEALLPLKKLDIKYTIDLTGGCVRDFILNKQDRIKDLDIMISIPVGIYHVKKKDLLEKEICTEEELNNVNWNDTDNDVKKKAKIIQLLINQTQDVEKIYYFSEKERQQVIGQSVYGGMTEDKFGNDRLLSVIKMAGQKTHFPIDLLITDFNKPEFLNDFDFDICKASICIINPVVKKDFPKNYSHLISRFNANMEFWADVHNKKMTYGAGGRSEYQIGKSFGNHLPRLLEKFPDYEVLVTDKKAFNYTTALNALFTYKLSKNLNNKEEKTVRKQKI